MNGRCRLLTGLIELSIYGALAVAVALLWLLVLGATHGLAPARSIRRSGADARLLTRALDIPAGRPALIEFMDFECPPCRASYPGLRAILASLPTVAYKPVNFPLRIHPYAFDAAVACEIGTEHGLHDRVFQHLFTGEPGLDRASLNAYLSMCGLPAVAGKRTAKPYEQRVRDEMHLGDELKVQGTPTLFVLDSRGNLTEVRDLSLIPRLAN